MIGQEPCFICTKSGIGWSLDSLRFIKTLKLCKDHWEKVNEEIEKRQKDYLNTEEKVVREPGEEG